MACVEIGEAPVTVDVIAVLDYHPLEVAGILVDGFRVTVRSVELQALREVFFRSHPERVVGRISDAFIYGDIAERHARIDRAARRELRIGAQSVYKLVVVTRDV